MKKLNYYLLLLVMFLCCGITTAQDNKSAPGEETTKAYGILLFDQSTAVNKIVSFQMPAVNEFEVIRDFGTATYITAASCVDDKYYLAMANLTTEIAEKLCVYDMTTGTLTEIATLDGFPNKIADMTYDYSTNTMYAISGQLMGSGDPGVSGLYTVNLETGATDKIADMNNFFFTLACSYGGQLYGVSKYGNLCMIDKSNGTVEEIGPTGINPTNINSMEFNHTDKTLYWTVNTVYDESLLCTIDVSTGTATTIGTLGPEQDANIGGLYIPFNASADDTPAAVSNLSITPDNTGACRATLSWTNPTHMFGGAVLSSLKQVDIYRNEQLIHSVKNTLPGAKEEYTDVIDSSEGMLVTYRIVPVNEKGEGVSTEQEIFVGEDLPAAPANVTFRKEMPDKVTIQWDAPAKGTNGGWIDLSSLTYSIVRMPDNEILADNLNETVFTDENIAKVNSYTYEITSYTHAGKGGTVSTDKIVLGPGNTLPYTCNFSTQDEVDTWTIVNYNNDSRQWEAAYNGGSIQFNGGWNTPEPSDDWIISHDFIFEAGKEYKGTFDVKCTNANKMKVWIGQGNTVESMTTELGNYDIKPTYGQFVTYDYTFTVPETGMYNIAFQLYSDGNSSFLYLTGVTLEQMAATNLQMTALKGPESPVAGNTYTYQATILNKGSNPVSSYTTYLKNKETGETLTSVRTDETMESGAEKVISLQWTPTEENTFQMVAEVICQGDEVANDNTSQPMDITVLPEGSADVLEIGTIDNKKFDRNSLFNFYNKNSAALNIYSPEDIGREEGLVESFVFTINNGNSYAVEKSPVKIYMANTDWTKADYTTGWIPESEMTLVYDDSLTVQPGRHEITIPLTSKFEFIKGKNLAILTTHAVSEGYYNSVTCPYFTTTDGTATYYFNSDYSPFDFNNYGNGAWQQKAAVTLVMRCTGATVSGTVTGDNNQPLEGATLTILERNASVKSDAEGHYTFRYVPDGTYTVRASLFGYPDKEFQVSVSEGKDVQKDVSLSALAAYEVKGIATDRLGKPLSEAAVIIDGYERWETTTGTDGTFSFANVHKSDDKYTLTISKEWYRTYSEDIYVSDTDIDMKEIAVDYLIYAPVNAVTATNDNSVILTWENATNITELRTENGEPGANLGIENAVKRTVLGTVYRTPVALKYIRWYVTAAGGPHYFIDLYIFALDDNGEPTNNILYSSYDVRSYDDQWTEYELPETVYAPNGCVIALAYEGYLGIGTDDGKDLEYPFAERTHVFSGDYMSGDFDYIEEQGETKNLMIRAKGYILSDNGNGHDNLNENSAFTDLCSYKVWRFTQETEDNPDQWTMLTEEPVNGTDYQDDLSGLKAGTYAYAVRSVYPDGTMSHALKSTYMAHDMYTSVTVPVKSNSKNESALGATVTLSGKNTDTVASATVGEDGQAVIRNIWKDTYDITISLAGYETVYANGDFTEDNSYTTGTYTLKEVIVTPYNLTIEENEENASSPLFTWNTSETIFDDFEGHDDFAVNSEGEAGWRYIDGDGQYTYGISNFDFPGNSGPMAYIVFNPLATEPAIDFTIGDFSQLKAHSGDKYLVSFAASDKNDDWIISPALNYAHDFCFSFYASSYSSYPNTFNVAYSEVENPEESDFILLAENITPGNGWTEYSYTVPQSAKHVAICNVSDGENAFMLMIDDIYIGSLPDRKESKTTGNSVQRPEVSYEVYLDGELVTTTEAISYRFENLTEGRHTAGVKAVYYSGSSEIVTLEFGIGSGIGDVNANSIRVYPNPTRDQICVEGEYTRLAITAMDGTRIREYQGIHSTIDISDLSEGVYLLIIKNDNSKTNKIEKITVIK